MAVTRIPAAAVVGQPSAQVVDGSTPAHGTRADTYWTDADRASVAGYLASGDRMANLAGVVWKACVPLILLILAAWVLGVLPVAVRLF
jgi:hypothetical protein